MHLDTECIQMFFPLSNRNIFYVEEFEFMNIDIWACTNASFVKLYSDER